MTNSLSETQKALCISHLKKLIEDIENGDQELVEVVVKNSGLVKQVDFVMEKDEWVDDFENSLNCNKAN
ncbi:MAG: hypothetical protein DRQ46_00105 [Gammaproteobacteria bacterium]|nr:MAG: hypothetical protein DRQ46_00105 [Gammaproteobacteria bacterium]